MNSSVNKTPPKSASAAMLDGHESVLLAALMDGHAELPVTADDFSSPPNKTIFHHVMRLTNRCLLAVTNSLRESGELEKVGGAYRVSEIAQLPHDPANLEYALGEVLEHSRKRQAAEIGARLQRGDIAPEQGIDELLTLVFVALLAQNLVDRVDNDPDTILNFTRHEQADCFTVEATLRNHPPIEPFVVRWRYPLFYVASELDPTRLKKRTGAAEEKFTIAQLVEQLTSPMETTEFCKIAVDETGMSKRTFYRCFKQAKESGKIVPGGKGKWKRAT
jgi:DnaB-like helicase N terminal domain